MSELRNVSSSPHVRHKITTGNIMVIVAAALLPAALFGIYNFGIRAFVVMAISVGTCVGVEYIYEYFMKKPITIGDFSAVVTGLLLGLNLPVSVPLWIPVIGGVFAILVVKQIFGGLGQNIVNPALAARCFLLISFTGIMTDFPLDGVSGATPLALLKAGERVNTFDMIIGRTAGVIGETSVIAILLGALVLLGLEIIDLRIPGACILSFILFITLFGGRGFDWNYITAHLAGGGFMFGVWFMATDYVTSPITGSGKLVFGAFIGIMTGILRLFGSSAEGLSYAILLGNILVPLIERVTVPTAFGKGGREHG